MDRLKTLIAGEGRDLSNLEVFRATFATNFLALMDIVLHLLYLTMIVVWLQNTVLFALQAAGLFVCCACFVMNRFSFGPKHIATVVLTVELGLGAIIWMIFLGFGGLVYIYLLCALVPHYLFSVVKDKTRVALIWFLVICTNLNLVLGFLVPPLITSPHLPIFAATSLGLVFSAMLLELSVNHMGINIARDSYEGSIASAKDESMTDPLTGLRNRRYLQISGNKFPTLSKTTPCAVAILDLDHFKAVNDNYGHAMGDALLIHFSRLLIKNFRAADLVLRWGGEEFLIIFTGATVQQAAAMVDKFRSQIKSIPLKEGEVTLNFTFTAGVSALPSNVPTLISIDNADRLLYTGKNSGRDCVVSDETPFTEGHRRTSGQFPKG